LYICRENTTGQSSIVNRKYLIVVQISSSVKLFFSSRWRTHREEFILALILLLASVLRLVNYSAWSLSNDELSALNRLQYSGLSELINLGVMKNDFHPAGVQVFLYLWTSVFGTSPESVRLPFVLMGILSVWVSYLIAARWFSKTTGLLVALSMAFLAYPILYSQLGRPYSPGLLFSLLSVFFWTRIIFDRNYHWRILAAYVIFTHLATITHHFSFLFVLITGIHGLFFLTRNNWKPYLLSALIILILYLPHLRIFLYQFGIGGVGGAEGWLGKPAPNWILGYLSYSFNDSPLLLLVFGTFLILPFTYGIKTVKFDVFQKLSFSFFLVPLVIGYLYSIFRNPVLQYSILLFSFPFLLFFIFSFYRETINRFYLFIILILAILGTGDLFLIKKYYKEQHFAEFWGISRKIASWNQELGTGNIGRVAEVNAPFYIHYYLDRYEKNVEFFQYKNDGLQDLRYLKNYLDQSANPFFMYARTKPAPLTVPEMIQTRYPYVLDYRNYDDLSEFYLFSREPNANNLVIRHSVFNVFNDFESDDLWTGNSSHIDTNLCRSGKRSYRIDSSTEYGPGASIKSAGVLRDGDPELIKASVWIYSKEKLQDTHLILSFESDQGKIIKYEYANAEFWANAGVWQKLVCVMEIPDVYPLESQIKSYVWNKNKQEFLIDDFLVEVF